VRYQPRYLSNEGRLFFDSNDALVPKDVNQTWDVYEYEPAGAPSGTGVPSAGEHPCSPASSSDAVVYRPAREYEAEGATSEEPAGCVGLLSSGESPDESALLDVSQSGGDVFFMTTSKLSAQDHDDSYDVYDAHECTGRSPCITPASSTPTGCTTGEACRPSTAPQPTGFTAPASATFNGPGNPAPPSPPPPAGSKPKTAEQIRIEKLDKALKTCRTKKNKHKRATCERAAHKTYAKKASRAKNPNNKRRIR